MPTPKGGVVSPALLTSIGLRDRMEGTVGFTTSLEFGRKLERIAADPRIAVLYHTRDHGYASRPGIVLMQGVATIQVSPMMKKRVRSATRPKSTWARVAEGPALGLVDLDLLPGPSIGPRAIPWDS